MVLKNYSSSISNNIFVDVEKSQKNNKKIKSSSLKHIVYKIKVFKDYSIIYKTIDGLLFVKVVLSDGLNVSDGLDIGGFLNIQWL